MTIKSSVLNFVRSKADEAKQLADLHATLVDISNRDRDLKASKEKLNELDAACAKQQGKLLGLQGDLAKRQLEHDAMVVETGRLKKEGDGIVAEATKRANALIAEANVRRDVDLANWRKSVDEVSKDLAVKHAALADAVSALESKHKEYAELQKVHADLQHKHKALQDGLNSLRGL